MSYGQLQAEVIATGLCARCGLCAGVCPVQAISMGEDGFPRLAGRCTKCGFCVKCCPGAEVDFSALSGDVFSKGYDPGSETGYVENMLVAHAGDSVTREMGTSGGVVTALLIYLLEQGKIDGAVVAGMDSENPCRSVGVLAMTTREIRAAAKSKYCLTPILSVLAAVRKCKGRFAVVGLPCQIHGLRKLARVDPGLSKKIIYTLGLCCNCNMERNGHLEAMKACRVDPTEVERFQFRGGPWPGGFNVQKKDGTKTALHRMRYSDLMNVMFRLYGAERCYLCYDALSEFADISCGDFHAGDYSDRFGQLTGCTLVFQRTPLGKQLLDMAEEAGALIMYPLPVKRMSKRISGMAKAKKNRCLARLYRRERQNRPRPDYHFPLLRPSAKARRGELFYRFFTLFRGPLARIVLLRLLFSPVGECMARLNVKRKELFCNYHGN